MYFELLSAFDTLGYYDQLGVASDYCSSCENTGTVAWTVAWEQGIWATDGTGCGGDGSPNDNAAYYLSPFSWYTFMMYLDHTNLNLEVRTGDGNFNGTATLLWSTSITDSAYSFETDSTYTGCHGQSYPQSQEIGLTLYQEVHTLIGSSSQPPWDFWFDQTNALWWSGSWWHIQGIPGSVWSNSCYGSSCPMPPHGYVMNEYSSYVVVANEAVWLDWASDYYSFAPGNGFSEYGDEESLGNYCPSNSCAVSMSCNYPPGWTGGDSYGTPYYSFSNDYYTTTSPLSTSSNQYYAECFLTLSSTSPNEYTQFLWYMFVT